MTDPEDIYVYSHYGLFGTKYIKNVIAVIRPINPLNNITIKDLETSTGLHIVDNNQKEVFNNLDERPIVIIDNYEYYNPEKLIKALKELEKSNNLERSSLRKTKPLNRWIIDKLSTNPNYRLDSDKLDIGYCVAEVDSPLSQATSSKGRLLLCRGLLKNELEASDSLTDTMFRCTTCGQCYDDVHSEELRINNAIIRARHEIVKKRGYNAPLRSILKNVAETGNPSGLTKEDRVLWYEDIAEEYFFKHNKYLYWTGCTTSYRLPDIVDSTVKIFEESELNFGLLGNQESCCGLILYLAGYFEEAEKQAKRVVKEAKKMGVRHVITSCAGCYYAFSRVYKELGVDIGFKVSHTTQLFDRLIKDRKLITGDVKGRYTWHDPCDLGRHSGVYEAPRNVLASIQGLEIIEPILTGQHTRCCGGGGGLMAYDYDLSRSIAESKYKHDIYPLKVEGIITGCPACILNLRGVNTVGSRVIDISQIIYESFH
jgi:heterodisulfide reductase subunit D